MLYVFHGYPTICALVLIDGCSQEWKIDLASTWQPKQVKGKAQIGRPFFLLLPPNVLINVLFLSFFPSKLKFFHFLLDFTVTYLYVEISVVVLLLDKFTF